MDILAIVYGWSFRVKFYLILRKYYTFVINVIVHRE